MLPISIRHATPQDAVEAVALLRDSITQLCVLDHQNDPATLERWLRNKQPEVFRRWLANPESCILVAEVDGRISGVGAIRKSGELDLCYVLPGRERMGVGRALIEVLETQAATWRIPEIRLISTATARAFYERLGYQFVIQESVSGFGVLGDYHYAKSLRES